MKEIPAAPYKAGILSLPQIAPLGKKKTQRKTSGLRTVDVEY